MEYRGIKLAESIKLYNKDGSYSKHVKRSLDSLVDMLIENGHEIVSEYKNALAKVLINYNCSHPPHNIRPNEYKSGTGCPKCSGHCPEQAKEELILQVKNNDHELLSEYINATTKILIDFNCGHNPHWTFPSDYKRGQRCPKCYGNCPEQANEDFIKFVEVNDHILLSEYINAHSKIQIDFKCGHEPHWIEPNAYKNGQRCPVCKESKGEKIIRMWLVENGFKFEAQKEYSSLVGLGGGLLSYDFYIPNQNLLIEYQGEFHDGSNGEYTQVNLEYRQEHDRRKKEYAKLHNINFLEIWHWDFDRVEEILENKLKNN